ncbi:MAG: hypothetical protein NC392_15955 [Roseburia sp.]|nr:hypothetical protein [Roseburia sp.]
MKRCKNTRRMAKALTGMFAFSFMLMNLTQVSAAEDKLADMNTLLENEAVQDTVGEDALSELQTFFLSGSEDDSYTDIVIANPEAEIIMPLLDPNTTQYEIWTVQPGTRYVSARFSLKKGQHVKLASLVSPSKVTYWMGIMKDSNGDAKCCEGQDVMTHTIEAWADGKYRAFIQNRGDKEIEVDFSYYYY